MPSHAALRLRAYGMTIRKFASLWLPLLVWMIFIFSASTDAMSAEHTSRFLLPFLRWLMPNFSTVVIEAIHTAIRKASHMTEYAILAALLWRAIHNGLALRINLRVQAAIVFIAAMVYAAGDEFHQSFVRSRGSSIADVLIDGCGIALGILVCWLITAGNRRTAPA